MGDCSSGRFSHGTIEDRRTDCSRPPRHSGSPATPRRGRHGAKPRSRLPSSSARIPPQLPLRLSCDPPIGGRGVYVGRQHVDARGSEVRIIYRWILSAPVELPCARGGVGLSASMLSHFSMTRKLSGPQRVLERQGVLGIDRAPYSMQPFSARHGGTLAAERLQDRLALAGWR